MDLKKISDEIKKIVSEKQKELRLSFVEDTHTYYMNNLKGEIVSTPPFCVNCFKELLYAI